MLSDQIRGHCVADLDPLDIDQARHADTEEEARNKFLTTYRYHTVYNIGKAARRPVETLSHRCIGFSACRLAWWCGVLRTVYPDCMRFSGKASCMVIHCASASGETRNEPWTFQHDAVL